VFSGTTTANKKSVVLDLARGGPARRALAAPARRRPTSCSMRAAARLNEALGLESRPRLNARFPETWWTARMTFHFGDDGPWKDLKSSDTDPSPRSAGS